MASRPGDDAATPGLGEQVELGRIGGAFGVKGWVKVISYTRPREGIFAYRRWYLGDGESPRAFDLLAGRPHGSGLIARLGGCEDRDGAQALSGCAVRVPRDALAANAPGEYYWRDLIGLAVANTDGRELGRVRELIETGANDVLVLAGERERLVPFIGEVIREVDLAAGRMIVEWDGDF